MHLRLRSRTDEIRRLETAARHEPDFDEADRLMTEAQRLKDELRREGDTEVMF